MTTGNNQDYLDAWRNLRERLAIKLAKRYFGIDVSDMEIRLYDVRKPLVEVLDDIHRRHLFESTIRSVGKHLRGLIIGKLKARF